MVGTQEPTCKGKVALDSAFLPYRKLSWVDEQSREIKKWHVSSLTGDLTNQLTHRQHKHDLLIVVWCITYPKCWILACSFPRSNEHFMPQTRVAVLGPLGTYTHEVRHCSIFDKLLFKWLIGCTWDFWWICGVWRAEDDSGYETRSAPFQHRS